MNTEQIRNYCLAKLGVREGLPFGESTLVFKVMEKMFLLLSLDDENIHFNVKCDPEKAIAYREQYDFVEPGYHQSKKHWNTVTYNGANAKILYQMIDESYHLVVEKLPKAQKALLQSS
jgi:predicted DNA-binding protein (MmcQ/YjbR family)